ncbi:hypothetical protein D3C87_1669500 [compost metagenome]
MEKWIYNFPNQFLEACKYDGLDIFLKELKNRNILTAIYSDYPAMMKLKAMRIEADLVVSSTQKEINAFKPVPKGLNYILSRFPEIDNEHCVFIGDRMELDGVCAVRASIPFLHISKKERKGFYHSILENLKNKK